MLFSRAFILFLLFPLITACGSDTSDTPAAEEPASAIEQQQAKYGGLALYTLREDLAGDPKAVLQEVADLGYQYIEAAGYKEGKFYGMAPADFKAYLENVGLTPISSHHSDVTLDNVDQVLKDLKTAGFQYLVIPIPPMGAFTYDAATQTLGMNQSPEEVMKNVNALAQKVSDAGLRCLYHNHDFEFVADENGIVPIDYFLENSDPKQLNFQMDLYWVTKAGADPVEYFSRYPGRFHSWHVKDMDDQGRFAPVGEGNIDFARILEGKEKSGMRFYLVEQDMCFNHTALEAIAISHKGLKGFGFK